MRKIYSKLIIAAFCLLSASCNCDKFRSPYANQVALPAEMLGKAEVVDFSDPEFDQQALNLAVAGEGEGGISKGVEVKILADVKVFRLWNGPDSEKIKKTGVTNRYGAWWSPGTPRGTVDEYRKNTATCKKWNDMTWVTTCVLKKGAIAVVGPTQSVSAEKCNDSSQANSAEESYPENAYALQIYIDNYMKYVRCDNFYKIGSSEMQILQPNP